MGTQEHEDGQEYVPAEAKESLFFVLLARNG